MTAENSTKKLRTEKSKREEETALVIKTILQLVIMGGRRRALSFRQLSHLFRFDRDHSHDGHRRAYQPVLRRRGRVCQLRQDSVRFHSLVRHRRGASDRPCRRRFCGVDGDKRICREKGRGGGRDRADGVRRSLLLFYILCLVGKFMAATSASGEKLPFYKLYEIRPLFLLTACLFVFAAASPTAVNWGRYLPSSVFSPFTSFSSYPPSSYLYSTCIRAYSRPFSLLRSIIWAAACGGANGRGFQILSSSFPTRVCRWSYGRRFTSAFCACSRASFPRCFSRWCFTTSPRRNTAPSCRRSCIFRTFSAGSSSMPLFRPF